MKINLTKAQAEAVLEAVTYYETANNDGAIEPDRAKARALRAGADRIAETLLAHVIDHEGRVDRNGGHDGT